MKKRFISLILTIAILCSCATFVFSTSAQDNIVVEDYQPKVSGSFVQSWFAYSWNEKRWDKEMTAYNEAGIDTLILGDVATKNSSGVWSYFYPSSVEELASGTYNGDVIAKALQSAKEHGIKVFLGMGGDDSWWSTGASQQYLDYCNVSAKIATDVYNKYYENNKESFGGFYYVPEIYNYKIIMSGKNADNLISGFNVIMNAINTANPNLPVMLSPFYNQSSSYMNLADTENFYKKFFTEVNFRAIDIFAPQDAVGAGWVKIDYVENVYKMYKNAIDYATKENHPIKFWANCEDFAQVKQSGDSSAFHTADLNKFVEQMTIASKYCQRIITFAYSHYYSPNNINPAWHNAYVKYAKTGQLSTTPPSNIEKLSVKTTGGNIELAWTPSQTSSAISRYAIRYNNRLMDYVVARRYDGGGAIDKITTKYTIRNQDLPTDDETFDVTVTPYDIYGNKGEAISFTMTKNSLSNDVIIDNNTQYIPVQMEEEFLPWYDFDFWTDGDSTMGTNKDKNNYLLEPITKNYTVSGVKENALLGNAMKITSRSSGSFEGLAINTINPLNPEYRSDFKDSKYFTLYVDTTQRNDPLRMWIILGDSETVNGKVNLTSFAPIEGSLSYIEMDGQLKEIENSDQSLTIPADYKGRIFIPINKETFQPIWGSKDIDGKINLETLPVLRLSFDNVGSNGSSFLIDEIGFMRSLDKAPVYETGDVNNDKIVNTLDSLLILKNIVGMKRFSSSSVKAADYNADTKVDTRDALTILKKVAGLI